MAELTIISHNVRGLNSPTKRSVAAKYYRNLKADIIALQETHLADGSSFPYLHKQYSQVYYTTFPSKRRGVAFYIKSALGFQMTTVVKDPNSQYIILQGTLLGKFYTLVNVYAPSEGQKDKTPSSRMYIHKPPTTLTKSLKSLALVDAWRSLHPTANNYTFFSYPHQVYSSIDYFFTPIHMLCQITEAVIHPITWSDHAAIGITMMYRPILGPRTSWRLNEALLSIPNVSEEVANDLEQYFLNNLDPALSMGVIWAAHKATIRGSFIKLGSRLKKIVNKLL
ncbi:hypothetical protein XELAEV_18037225mg [Xenopus laevis]|uniref:exodeoxyribonuclease III n=1 Tax=Xenopus laevis TaxID=8355 RepID=A0A974CCD0_XENLA|nr:hypothetical protein XELAEV_18037225mg [Xenopus laevis]